MCGVLTTLLFGDDEDEVEKARDDLDAFNALSAGSQRASCRAQREEAHRLQASY